MDPSQTLSWSSRITFASDHAPARHRILPSPKPSGTRVTFSVFRTPLQNQGHFGGQIFRDAVGEIILVDCPRGSAKTRSGTVIDQRSGRPMNANLAEYHARSRASVRSSSAPASLLYPATSRQNCREFPCLRHDTTLDLALLPRPWWKTK